MDPVNGSIIDLLEVVSEGKPFAPLVSEPVFEKNPGLALTPEWEEKIAQLVREEVGRLIRGAVEEEVARLVREVLVQETEKALTREIERLKSS
ncbi:MAG: hypothetical protein HY892_03665 [Deltaproteobacteria bacterium]|nr:hypothetical protein [Deltaproteobacteria bacterium]